MTNYSTIKKGIKPKYARGGRVPAVVEGKKSGGKTVINIITAPPQPAPAPAMAPPPPMPAGPPPMPPAGPPAGGAAALQAMGEAGPPPMGQFKRGGRVKHTAGAESGPGRLQATRAAKRAK